MPTKDLYEKPFTEETKIKLEIFEKYAEAWIPTFIMADWCHEINIFDLFAGAGYDEEGTPGSSIRILGKILEYVGDIFQKGKRVIVYFNELDGEKFILLKSACSDFIEHNKNLKRCCDKKYLQINYSNKACENVFGEFYEKIRKLPSLVYLDQNGVKFLSDEYFLKLADCKQVDFLYFISSSYFRRFGGRDEFRNILEIDLDDFLRDPYRNTHQYVVQRLREKVPGLSKTKLYPFTIKKGRNIYGIIFGASHIRAVDKFLDIAWKTNPVNGNANFDIDGDDLKIDQPDLFGNIEYTKIDYFKKQVRDKVINGDLITNKDVYLFTLENGHIPRHSKDVLVEMKKDHIIDFDGSSPLVNYDNVIKRNRIISYRVL